MVVHHRVARVAVAGCVVGAAVAIAVGLHAGTASPADSLRWGPEPSPSIAANTSPSPPAATTGAATSSAAPVPQASPNPASAQPLLGGLQLPLSAVFRQLNGETRNTAAGELSILREIGDAIRDRVADFLRWISGGR